MQDQPVRKFMSSPVTVLRQSAKLSEARRLLVEEGFHHVPVVNEEGSLLGLLSSTDLLSLSFGSYGVEGETMDTVIDTQFKLSEVMATELETLGPEEPLSRADELLATGSFHSLPIVDGEGKLLGIITSSDLIECLLRELN